MEMYRVTFTQEKQFFLGNPTVKVIVDDKMVCELKLKTGDSASVPLSYGKHRITLTGSGKRLDSTFFVCGNGTVKLRWNKTFGKPEIADLGNFDLAKNINRMGENEGDEKVSVTYNGGGAALDVVRTIREITGVTLKEAQQMCSRVPCVIKPNVTKAEAAFIKEKFSQIGVSVTISASEDPTLVSQDKNLPVDIAFGATKMIGNYFWINENKKSAATPVKNFFGAVTGVIAFPYTDILDFELLQDGSSVIKKGGLGRAAIGGLLFGGSGAIVGALTGAKNQTPTCSELRIKITLNNVANPVVFIDFVKGTAVKKDSVLYRSLADDAASVISMLEVITAKDSGDKQASAQAPSAPLSGADEIRKYKALLDEGIISQEEFEEKKRQLLGL